MYLSCGVRLAAVSLSGQAAREMGRSLHRVCHWFLTGLLLLGLIVMGLAWRLGQGPLDVSFLNDQVQAAINARIAPVEVAIGGTSIAWGGFTHGPDQPLRLRLTDVAVTAQAGTRLRLPAAEVSVSASGLLHGRVQPRTIALEGAHLTVIRKEDGSLDLRFGEAREDGRNHSDSPLLGVLAALGAPATTDMDRSRSLWSQIRLVTVRGATVVFDDRRLGKMWSAERTGVVFSRHRDGGVDGHADLVVAVDGRAAKLGVDFTLATAGTAAHVAARLSAITPQALAGMAPALAPLARLDAPVSLEGEADLGADLKPARFRLSLRADAGRLRTDGGTILFRRASAVVAGTPEEARLESATIELVPKPGGPATIVRAEGKATHRAGRYAATLSGTLDRVAFADVAAIWPPDIAPPARAWVTGNILGGTAHDGKFQVAAAAPDDFSSVALTQATATLEGDDVVCTWIPTVPPVERGKAHLAVTDPDRIEIDIPTGRQVVRGGEPLPIREGRVTLTGLSKKDQDATITFKVAGAVASAIALLREPRLKILDKHPIDLRDPAGELRMNMRIVVPLKLRVGIDDIAIHGTGDVAGAHLTGIVGGRDLDDGTLSLDVDTNHLELKGTARLARIPAEVTGFLDFQGGPPTQVTQRYTAAGVVTAPTLAAAGLDPGDWLDGEARATAAMTQLRNGEGEVRIDADLTQAALIVSSIGSRKEPGVPAKATARVRLARDRMLGIDNVTVDGPGISVRATVGVREARMETVRIERAVFGRTNLTGTVALPRDGPIAVDVRGPSVDISGKVLETTPKRVRGAPEPPPGPAVTVRARFDTVFLAHERTAHRVALSADYDGRLARSLALTGSSVEEGGAGKPFSAEIVPLPRGRRIALGAKDAGSLLRGLDITDTIQDGTLVLRGTYDDTTREHTLSGTLDMSDFRVSRAQTLGKLLQALTLYGLGDAMSGPGLAFSRVIAPFEFGTDTITLREVRAFSPSLGVTAKGQLDRTTNRLDLEGTVVPAYVLNTMLGRIPVIGGLFRNEKGGGLIAVNYSLRGPVDDPAVTANPLSALTPGFLRGMFDVFGKAPFDKSPPARQNAGDTAHSQ